ncbi:energy transducer TonB [Aliikangiella coralliicola]|uniref:Protein TonB n=1 Tax=Aliikangiella coralliicola TaxID=2592383 RepID=A0A545UAV9_9GAMM|nr:energy transducer TonB [Aliikangiella coralliicola]TQV86599.1 energy transducer TonB [Aliikangiella coralliicola]
MQRIFIGLGIGGSVTFGLFVLMAFLIKAELRPPDRSESPPIQISMVEPDDELKIRDRRIPKKPPPPKNPPPPQKQKIAKVQKPTPQNMNIKMAKLQVGVSGDTYLGQVAGTQGMGDGDAIPMVVIEPRYPRKAAMEGIEGWVRFQFTVAPDGTPKDVEVLDAKPKRVFERDARKAIYKWKFKPKVVDGKAIEQPNMRYTMEFKLGE